MEAYEVVIVGAGPAGLGCAQILAQNNWKVLVLEKNRTIGDKACAGGLILNSRKEGILGSRMPKGIIQKKFSRMTFHTPHQRTKVELERPFLATLDREKLGKWMAKKARKAGAEIRASSLVTKINEKFIEVNSSQRTVNKYRIAYKYLIGADGSASIVRKYLGLSTDCFLEAFYYWPGKQFFEPEVFFDPAKFGSAYLWIFPHQGHASIGSGGDIIKGADLVLGLKMADIRKNLDIFCRQKFNIEKAEFRAAAIGYDYKGHDFGNKFLLGDAAGFASGLTGEGLDFAIKSGEDVAKKIIDPEYGCPNIRRILRIKKFHETILRALQHNRLIAKAAFELIVFLFKSRLIFRFSLKMLQ